MTYREAFAHPNFPNGIRGLKPATVAREARLQALSITADSVVATAMLTPSPENIGAQVHWGDGQIDAVDFRKSPAHDPNVPAGTFKLQHVYQRSSSDGLFMGRVTVIVAVYSRDGGRCFDGRGLDLKPRFLCRLYPTVVKATHHDTFEERSEFDIMMYISDSDRVLVDRHWHWEPKTFDIDLPGTTVGIVAEFMLTDSATTTELTLGEDVWIHARYVDLDGAWGLIKHLFSGFPYEFDGSNSAGLFIDPREIVGPFEFVQTHGSGSETFEFHISGSMDLIVPVDRGPVAFK